MEFPDKAPWIPVVGEFLVAFGSIESSVNHLLSHVCSRPVVKVVSELDLNKRIQVLTAGLEDWVGLSNANRNVIKENLVEVLDLAKTRNLIAHNPLVFSAFFDAEGPAGRINIWSEKSQKGIELPELTKRKDRIVLVARALNQNWVGYELALRRGEEPVLRRP
jgi:hypothetical protein